MLLLWQQQSYCVHVKVIVCTAVTLPLGCCGGAMKDNGGGAVNTHRFHQHPSNSEPPHCFTALLAPILSWFVCWFGCLLAGKWKLENGNDSAFARAPSGTSKQKRDDEIVGSNSGVRALAWFVGGSSCSCRFCCLRLATWPFGHSVWFTTVCCLAACLAIIFLLVAVKVFRHISWRQKIFFALRFELFHFDIFMCTFLCAFVWRFAGLLSGKYF